MFNVEFLILNFELRILNCFAGANLHALKSSNLETGTR